MAEIHPEESGGELTPSSDPPPDVNIPVESIYGDNTAIQTPPPNNNSTSQKPKKSNEPDKNVIRIGLLPFLFIAGLLLAGAAFIPIALLQKNQANAPQTQTQETQPTAGKNKERQRSGFIPDRGIYRRENTQDYRDIAKNRISLAKQRIIWFTDSPDSPIVLAALAAKKNEIPLPIFILTGKETNPTRLQNAAAYNIPSTQVDIEFETPYNLLFIDDKLLVDLSRNHWIWESQEPKILEDTKNWLQTILEEQQNK